MPISGGGPFQNLTYNVAHLSPLIKRSVLQDAEGKLGTIKVSIPYNMTQTEFINAMESVAPLTNERLWKKLMKESYKSSKSDVTLISQLASGYSSNHNFFSLVTYIQ